MSVFSKPEVVFLKESSDSKLYLEQLESLQKEVPVGSDLAAKLEKEIAITKAGIAGEDAIIFELKNSGMDLVVLHDIYIETSDGRGAQIDFVVITPYVRVFIECKNLFGDIEITGKGDFIRTFSFGGRKIREGICDSFQIVVYAFGINCSLEGRVCEAQSVFSTDAVLL